MHDAATHFLSGLMIVIGVAMFVSTVARGGGPISFGVVLGILFMAAGAGRIYVQRKIR